MKDDPLSCDNNPSTNFTVTFKDGSTFASITVNASVQVAYPASTFSTKISCAKGCSASKDSNGNSICSCPDVSSVLRYREARERSHMGRVGAVSTLHTQTRRQLAPHVAEPPTDPHAGGPAERLRHRDALRLHSCSYFASSSNSRCQPGS